MSAGDVEDEGFRSEDRYRAGIRKEYANDRVAVSWEPALCIHVAACLRDLPDVFDPDRRPWIEVGQCGLSRSEPGPSPSG